MGEVDVSTRRLSTKPVHGRVVNAVASLLRKTLTVPEIFLKPRIPGAAGIDILAVNHAGSGDLHGVEIAFVETAPSQEALQDLVARVSELPVHYKYLAMPKDAADSLATNDFFRGDQSFDKDGFGRLGLVAYPLFLLDKMVIADESELPEIRVRPERYLLRGERLRKVEHFLAKATPDMTVRI